MTSRERELARQQREYEALQHQYCHWDRVPPSFEVLTQYANAHRISVLSAILRLRSSMETGP